ncbi:NUDIX hydrolase [Leptolyngbya sp. 7M]|uniref:NUDIX hydrolase n=1 Tax=Leptolyngbya sp. 7M TaxID=2812896 RepID=UPI001B8B21B4|nr:NUDIX hydrolase [Leptolyngbya sp. 7M]QYO63603.1 NUDIX hydrolase [Leptolyngbya sp. 7M]
MKPEILSSKTIYTGKVFDIRVDKIREGEVRYERDIIVHRGSAVILPVFADGTIALVRQYRHAAGKYLLELAAGTLEAGEDPLDGTKRELEEEIGVTAGKIEKLSEFYVSPGFLTEKMYLFLATDLTETKQNLEADEILTIERHSFPALLEMIQNGEIEDAKTIVGILLASTHPAIASS